jgi:hypothetical protein
VQDRGPRKDLEYHTPVSTIILKGTEKHLKIENARQILCSPDGMIKGSKVSEDRIAFLGATSFE